jgi:gliding motility-associated-like protein
LNNWDSLSIQASSTYISMPDRIFTYPTLAPDGNVYFNSASINMTDTLYYSRIINTDSNYQISFLQDQLFSVRVQTGWTGAGIASENRLPNTPAYALNPNRYSIVAQNQCLGDSTRLSLYDYQNLDTVVWDLGDGSPRTNSFTPVHRYAAPGLYVVTAFTRYCNRPDTLYYQLEILGNPELPFADTSICRGDSLRLQLPANWQYQWSTGDSTAAVSLGAAGIYHVTINNGCFTATDSFELRIVDPATTMLPTDTGFCAGDSVWVDPEPLAGNVLWSDGGSGARWISQPGNYTLSMTNACGTENHSLSIGVYGSPPLALHDTSLCEGRVLRIELPEYWETDYLWQDGQNDHIRNLSDSGLYIVNASNPCGSSTDSFQLELRDCNCTLYLPNAFSPNGDGINDEFAIISRCALREFELLIYDRWGQNIFRSTNISQGWDGRFKGEMMPVGAYAFVIRYMPEGSGMKVDKGMARLVR